MNIALNTLFENKTNKISLSKCKEPINPNVYALANGVTFGLFNKHLAPIISEGDFHDYKSSSTIFSVVTAGVITNGLQCTLHNFIDKNYDEIADGVEAPSLLKNKPKTLKNSLIKFAAKHPKAINFLSDKRARNPLCAAACILGGLVTLCLTNKE